jgi:diguanylate cyclase (GGDEF)-like protein
MFIDLDKFKAINDSYGHEVGDQVLQAVGVRLQSAVRVGDTVSRRGGDEFAYLMLEAKDDASIEKLARKIGDSLKKPFTLGVLSLKLTASIGIATYPTDAQAPEELLNNADIAMYTAKQNDRSHLMFSEVAAIHQERAEFIGSVKPMKACSERVK